MTTRTDEMVSVFMLTYNQVHFVGQAIQSALDQEADFPIRLVIGDDCSTDGTLDVIKDLMHNHPGRIELLTHDTNLGIGRNFLRTLRACRGRYVAILDGDDYWIDPHKLADQVALLEDDPACAIVYSNVRQIAPTGVAKIYRHQPPKRRSHFDEMVHDNFIPSVSCVLRNRARRDSPPEWIANLPFGDWPLYLWTLTDGGRVAHLDRVTAVYRLGIGASSGMRRDSVAISRIKQRILTHMLHDSDFTERRTQIRRGLSHALMQQCAGLHRKRRRALGAAAFARAMWTCPRLGYGRDYLYYLRESLRN